MTELSAELSKKLSEAVDKMPAFPQKRAACTGTLAQHELPAQGTGQRDRKGSRDDAEIAAHTQFCLLQLLNFQVRIKQSSPSCSVKFNSSILCIHFNTRYNKKKNHVYVQKCSKKNNTYF